VDDVKRYFTSIWSDQFFKSNSKVAPINFRHEAYNETLNKKLKIGYLCYKTPSGEMLLGLESLPISKGTARAVSMTIDKLRSLGHTLVPFEMTLQEF
jgi:hypothetical protein